MNHSHNETWFHHKGIDWQVNANGSALDPMILRNVIELPLQMLSHHRKVFLLRFDLSCLVYRRSNRWVSVFIQRLKAKIRQERYSKRVGICWVREMHGAPKQHYHLMILLDGSKVNHSYQIVTWIEYYCELDGWHHESRYYNLTRNNESDLFEAIWHCSYLAKTRGKDAKAPKVRRFSATISELY